MFDTDDNNYRAGKAGTAISAYAGAYYGPGAEDEDTILSDLLGDMRHYCDAMGFDFHKLIDRSYAMYVEEVHDLGVAFMVGQVDFAEIPDPNDEGAEFIDSVIVEVSSLDDEAAEKFSKPWLIQFADGQHIECETEEMACGIQRHHRDLFDRDTETGEALAGQG